MNVSKSLSAISASLFTGLLASVINFSLPENVEAKRGSSAGSSGRAPSSGSPGRNNFSHSSGGESLLLGPNYLHALPYVFIIANNRSQAEANQAEAEAHIKKIDELMISVRPSREALSSISEKFWPFIPVCISSLMEKFPDAGKSLHDPKQMTLLRHKFTACLHQTQADEVFIAKASVRNEQDALAKGWAGTSASWYIHKLPECQRRYGIVPGETKGVTVEQAEATLRCAIPFPFTPSRN